MKINGIRPIMLITWLFILVVLAALPASADTLYAPDFLWARKIAEKTDFIDIANTHLGIPYRDDGALDGSGRFTTFADPGAFFDTPGLNCSGLVVSICRYVFNKNWSLQEVSRDRQANSGTNAQLGKDWDFGWDLVFNLSEGRPRTVIAPDRGNYSLENADGTTLRGFDLHDESAWAAVLAQMKPGRVYLATISKPSNRRGYKILHYHVVILLPDTKGGIWLYHATHRSHVHRININSPQGLQRFMSQFKDSRGETKKILILEVAPTPVDAAVQTVADTGVPGSPAPKGPQTGAESADGRRTGSDGSGAYRPVTAGVEAPGPSVSPDRGSGKVATSSGASALPKEQTVEKVISHLSGKVFRSFPGLSTQIPRFADEGKNALKFGFQNATEVPRDIEITLRTPDGEAHYKGRIGPKSGSVEITFPSDFGKSPAVPVKNGRYRADVTVDGAAWLADLFEVAIPREAMPKITSVSVPTAVKAGKSFTVRIQAENRGAESDYGGITVSSPDPSGLKLLSAKPGKIYGAGSTVLAITTDKIRTRVPMAERWIDLWAEKKAYDMSVDIQAGHPGTYKLYVRCALRGVNVKSSVILMDPPGSEAVDQQGFPVQVYNVKVE